MAEKQVSTVPVKGKRDPRREAMWQMTVSNMLTVAAYSFERRNPDIAKLFDMLNVDFILNFQRYMEEINGPVVRAGFADATSGRAAVAALLTDSEKPA